MATITPYKFGKDEDGFATLREEDVQKFEYQDFSPTWDPNKKFPPLKFFKHIDRATNADPELKSLLPAGGDYKLASVTPKLGTEITGVQLSQLDDKGKNELALLAAKRGLLIFRNQDFAAHGPKYVADYGKYYGPVHVHPTSGSPKTSPELHIVYRTKNFQYAKRTENTNTVGWHSDVSYELQPTGLTFFTILQGPDGGGDTVFADTVEAYNRLSPTFKKLLEGLYVEHSAVEQANFAKSFGRDIRREPVKNIHPLVRLHPITGDKILYVNPGFSRKIVGFKKQESDALLQFLYNHIASGHDFQVRANWEPGTVAVWDNRRVVHTAIVDWDEDEDVVRHGVRVASQAERPIADINDLNKEDENRLAE